MNAAKNPTIGKITCPLCGNGDATVHRNRKGGKLYIRCYPSDRDGCWTIQPHGADGQEKIKEKMRPLTLPEQDKEVVEVAEAASEQAKEVIRKERRQSKPESVVEPEEKPKRTGLSAIFFGGEDDE